MLKKALNISLIGLLASLLLVSSISTIAQTGQSSSSSSIIGTSNCQADTKAFLDKETKEYEQFIFKHLQNKKSALKLMQKANQRYFQYRAKLLNYRNRIVYLPSITNPDTAQIHVQKCQQIVDKYLEAAAKYQKRSLIGNAQRKNTIRLAERMRDINSKLDKLNRNVGNVKAHMQIFVQKVPCFVENCPPL